MDGEPIMHVKNPAFFKNDGQGVNEHERWPEIEHCKWPGNEHFGGQDAVERSMVGKRQSNFEIVIC